METEVKTSKRFSLDKFDFLKAALIAAATPIAEYVIEKLQSGTWGDIEWGHAAAVGVSAGLVYIVKNFLTTTQTTVAQK